LASELESLTEKYGRFSAQPFERGWGTTVGNGLRRALLSSIEGAAITAVKIEGVLHEFSSIPGVVEDATDIILNLKQVPIKLNTDLPKTIFFNVENPGPVTSAQIEEDADFAVLDKSVYIATVTEGGKLQTESGVKKARGKSRSPKGASTTGAPLWPQPTTTTKPCRSATSLSIAFTRRCARSIT